MRIYPFHLFALVAPLLSPLTEAASTTRNALASISNVRNATIHTRNGRVTAVSHFELSLITRNDLHVKFSLEPNHDILADQTTVTYLAADGSVSKTESIDRLGHKVYKGVTWTRNNDHQWEQVGWARILLTTDGTRPDFEGAFSIGHVDHHIQSAANFDQTRHPFDPQVVSEGEDNAPEMIVWRDADILPSAADLRHDDLRRRSMESTEPACVADELPFNVHPDHPIHRGYEKQSDGFLAAMDVSQLFGKRQIDGATGGNGGRGNLVSTIGNPAGCPTTRKVALVGIATDCTYTAQFNSTESVRTNIINLVNTASGVYESTFNISLGLQNLTVSDASCPGTPPAATEWNQPCSNGVTISDRLSYFSSWRGQRADNNAYWTLLSTCNTGSAIGLAWLGQACVNQANQRNDSVTGNGQTGSGGDDTVAGANVVVRTQGASEWQVFAHESGHTFGAVHDCDSSACAQGSNANAQQCCPLSSTACDADQRFIMNPSAVNGVNRFSMCSIGNICNAMGRGYVKTDCLSDNKGVTTISGQQCGNGIVEPGEDCDCGGEQGCGDNACCNPTTCKFLDNAVCDDSNEDCCRDCQFANNGTVCRPSTGACDPEEVCPGNLATCPEDKHAPDGDGCGNGLQCASGQCTSRDLQCQDVMSSYTSTNNSIAACDSPACSIKCRSADWGPNVCYGPQQNYVDGTPCNGDGKCSNGVCRGATVGGWFREHKNIIIGVCAAVGGLILLAVLSCIFRRCRDRSRRTKMPIPGQPPMTHPAGTWHPGYHNQLPSQGWYGNSRPGPNQWNGPPVPPPAYYGSRPQYG